MSHIEVLTPGSNARNSTSAATASLMALQRQGPVQLAYGAIVDIDLNALQRSAERSRRSWRARLRSARAGLFPP
jgi:hypothetical protein